MSVSVSMPVRIHVCIYQPISIRRRKKDQTILARLLISSSIVSSRIARSSGCHLTLDLSIDQATNIAAAWPPGCLAAWLPGRPPVLHT
eukprot:5658635-Heterocapsa_arctica.AAC.1